MATNFFVKSGEFAVDAGAEVRGVPAPGYDVLENDVAMRDEDLATGEIDPVVVGDIWIVVACKQGDRGGAGGKVGIYFSANPSGVLRVGTVAGVERVPV